MKITMPLAAGMAIAALITFASLRPVAAQSQRDADEQAIKTLLERHYVDAVFRKRDSDLMRGGFADTFVMQVYWDGELSTRTFDEWLVRMALDGKPSEDEVRGEVTVLDISGVAAVARLDFYRESVHQYTDYFGLYWTGERWQIVTKHFRAHTYEGHDR